MTGPPALALAQLAHDLRNRFSQIMALAEQAREGDPAQVAAALDAIGDAALRGGQALGRLIEPPRGPAALIPLDDTVRPIVDGMRVVTGRGIPVRMALGAPGRAVRLRPDELEDALQNLARNARDAMPDGGVLTVRTGLVPGGPGEPAGFIEVSDTGSGIPPESLAQIFTPYVTTKRGQGGTGLGLPSVRASLRRAGGDVLVQSSVGAGTVVRLELPSWPLAEEAGSGDGRCILLVDDDTPQCHVASLFLNRADWRVRIAGTVAEALEVLRAPGPLHLMVTDVALPDGSGRDLIGQARLVRPALPVIVASGYAPGPVDQPGVHHLTKPFTCRRLAELAGEVALCPSLSA